MTTHRHADGQAVAGGLVGGRFRLVERLDRGPFGDVWEAVDEGTGARRVVKVGDPDVAPWGPAREIAVAARGARHPSLLRPLDAGELADGRPWLAAPWVEGAPLSRVLRGGPLGEGAVALVLQDVASALEALHAVGVLHRDLKPANVLLGTRPPPTAVLLDLGVAALSLSPPDGLRTGTPRYAAPEQRAGTACGPAADVWGLGVLGLAALGRWPQRGAAARPIVAERVPRSALGALLGACLQPSPSARPPLARVRRKLQAVTGRTG